MDGIPSARQSLKVLGLNVSALPVLQASHQVHCHIVRFLEETDGGKVGRTNAERRSHRKHIWLEGMSMGSHSM
jgi:hypothetical protein